jgi:hypothetical protein
MGYLLQVQALLRVWQAHAAAQLGAAGAAAGAAAAGAVGWLLLLLLLLARRRWTPWHHQLCLLQ